MSNTAFNSNFVSISGGSNSIQDFRLTLVSDTPVMTSEVLAATTLYLTPYVGNKIALYNDTSWDVVESSQVSISLSTVAADTNYDVFAYNNSGTLTLELLAWTNSGAGTSTRATALAYQHGVLVKSGAPTRRYIGTIRGSASGQCQFSFGAVGTSNIEAKLYVWNYDNRVSVNTFVADSTSSWTISGGFRAANSNSSFRTSFVVGVKEANVSAFYSAYTTGNSSIATRTTLGFDTTTSPAANATISTVSYAQYETPMSTLSVTPAEGFHFISAIEQVSSSAATSYGYSIANVIQTGLTFVGWF